MLRLGGEVDLDDSSDHNEKQSDDRSEVKEGDPVSTETQKPVTKTHSYKCARSSRSDVPYKIPLNRDEDADEM